MIKNYKLTLLLKGVFLAFLFSLICFFILSIILSFTSASEKIIQPTSYIVIIISVVFAGGYVAPVSYTHLDVYKRQGIYNQSS